MHQWSTIPGFDGQPTRFGIASACHCLICGSRRMAWQDGVNTVHHYATHSQYLGTTEPECTEADLAELELPFTLLQPQSPMTTATIQRIEQKIQDMIGLTFLFMQDPDPHTILNYDLRNNRLIISSDRRMFNFEAKNALKLLEAFRPVEPQSRAEELFEGVMAMAQGHTAGQPDPDEVPVEPEAEVTEMLPESEHTHTHPIVEEMKELAVAVVDKAREMDIQVETENPAKAEGRSISDRPWPVALYQMLTPIVSDYEKALSRVRHYRDAKAINRAIYLHPDAEEVDAELAEEIYTLAIERAQQEVQDTEKEFRQVIVDYISITREL
ncbi:hypothetical protein [Salmonirosea aquatica]|uniref:Uncharacterized protein n=1 Tax=Salmonirosea aquatica TaxID=2654236 RepID=A0A7C9FRU0_9BACT|nr:hypothetical protein [Cytophagaceae bacterium SJW1-29]